MTNFRQHYFPPQDRTLTLSERVRMRLGSHIANLLQEFSLCYRAATKISYDIGIKIDCNAVGYYFFEEFFNTSPEIDLLSTLTPIYQAVTPHS